MGRLSNIPDKGDLTILGNALLLGFLARAVTARHPDATEEEKQRARREISECRDLRELLELSGALDAQLGVISECFLGTPGAVFDEVGLRLDELVESGADIATFQLGDIDIPQGNSDIIEIEAVLRDLPISERELPIAEMRLSAISQHLLKVVKNHFGNRLAKELGLSTGVVAFIGLEAVIARKRLQSPPAWQDWNSMAARQAREEQGWLNKLRFQAERLILAPIVAEYGDDPEDLDLAELGSTAVSLQPSHEHPSFRYYSGLGELGTMFCFANPSVRSITDDLIDRAFPDYGASGAQKNFSPEADARNFLYFVSHQIAWRAAKEGWAICIAEDDIVHGGGIFSWVKPDKFQTLSEEGCLALPSELDVATWAGLEERSEAEVGADRLWFALSRDLLAYRNNSASKPGPKTGPERSREKRAMRALKRLVESNPDSRLKRDTALPTLMSHGFSEKAAIRIWDSAAPDVWRNPGRFRRDVLRLQAEDFAALLAGI